MLHCPRCDSQKIKISAESKKDLLCKDCQYEFDVDDVRRYTDTEYTNKAKKV